MMYFAGASPARRDFGRGYNAAQWARYCGRHMCAESIEKFVRMAVQHGGSSGSGGGGGLISFSSDSQQSLKVKKSKKNNGESRIRSVVVIAFTLISLGVRKVIPTQGPGPSVTWLKTVSNLISLECIVRFFMYRAAS